MQEMGQEHVDYYLQLFDKVTKVDGCIMIQNSHDYVFKGNWNYPLNWERKLKTNTISSWTEYFPTEIFQKKIHANNDWNKLVNAGYKYYIVEKENALAEKQKLQNQVWKLESILNSTLEKNEGNKSKNLKQKILMHLKRNI